MNKLKMKSPNLADKNVEQIGKIFPDVITEIKDKDGNLIKGIDFELLKQKLSNVIVEDENEKYRLDWQGKKASLVKANTPVNKTLKPAMEKSVDFENMENLYFEGDNIEKGENCIENELNAMRTTLSTTNDIFNNFMNRMQLFLMDMEEVCPNHHHLIKEFNDAFYDTKARFDELNELDQFKEKNLGSIKIIDTDRDNEENNG